MSVKIKIYYPELKRLVTDPESVQVKGSTIGECLDDLILQYPRARELLLDKQGNLLKQVFVYINAESLQKPELSSPVNEKDTLIVAVLITGG